MTDKAVRPNIEFWRGSKGIIGEACEYSLRLEALLQQAVDTLCKYRATAPPAASVGDAPIREVIRCLDGIRARIDNHWYLPGEVAPELKRVIAKLEAALPGAAEKEAQHGER